MHYGIEKKFVDKISNTCNGHHSVVVSMHIGDGKTAGVSVGCGLWAYLYTSSVKEFYFFTVLRSPNEKAEKPVISLSIHYHGVCPESKIF